MYVRLLFLFKKKKMNEKKSIKIVTNPKKEHIQLQLVMKQRKNP